MGNGWWCRTATRRRTASALFGPAADNFVLQLGQSSVGRLFRFRRVIWSCPTSPAANARPRPFPGLESKHTISKRLCRLAVGQATPARRRSQLCSRLSHWSFLIKLRREFSGSSLLNLCAHFSFLHSLLSPNGMPKAAPTFFIASVVSLNMIHSNHSGN